MQKFNNNRNNKYEITREEINLRNNYSRDDIFRNSERIHHTNEDKNITQNNEIEVQKESIFELILNEKKVDEIGVNKNNNNIKNNKKFLRNNSSKNNININFYLKKIKL